MTAMAKTDAKAVVLSGGCFQNALLHEIIIGSLQQYDVLLHHKTPANDGALALGQAVIAAARYISQPESH